jgi:hypothetical protein
MKKLVVLLIAVLMLAGTSGLAQAISANASCTLYSDKSSYDLGETINLSWTSFGASYAAFQQSDSNGKDSLTLPGDKLGTFGTAKVTADVIGNPVVVLEVFDYFGSSNACSTTFTIPEDDGEELEKPDIESLRAARTYYDNGAKVGWNVFWKVDDAQRCVFKGGGKEYSVGMDDDIDVFPTARTTYTLWCANDDGTGKDGPSISKSITLDVAEGDTEDSNDAEEDYSDDEVSASVEEQIMELQKLLLSLLQQLIALIAAQS